MKKPIFSELVDIALIRRLLEAHYRVTGVLSAILDADEKILVSVGWQDICLRFHRAHGETGALCRESDSYIKSHLHDFTGDYLEYKCSNGLREVAVPIMISGEHVATFFTGQFFYDDEMPDPEFFRRRARKYGFNEESYLEALGRVPVFSRDQIRNIMIFYGNLVKILTELGYRNFMLAREVEERKETEKTLRQTEQALRTLNEELENRVEKRTSELAAMNSNLVAEVAERSRTEKELLESREKYKAIVEAFNGLIYICSPDYYLEYMNRRMTDRIGHDPVGELCYKVLFDRDSICPWCVNEEVFAGKTVRWEMHDPRDGRWYYVVDSPIHHADGTVSKQAMLMDITERKLAEEQLRQKKLLLEAMNSTLEKRVRDEVAKNREKDIILIQQNRQAALGETLEHIAHQWKQPLSTISLLAQDLKETWSYGELTEAYLFDSVTKITALIEHMAQTMNVFRNFFRPDREKSVFFLKDTVARALSFIEPALKFLHVNVIVDLDESVSATGYPQEFAQVLLNLLTNARDAFREKSVPEPTITVRVFREGGNSVVTVTDNAGGIPGAIIDNIFQLYFTTREASGGTGVGLYISKKIIEKNMGGTLSVANTDDGARFRIELGSTGP